MDITRISTTSFGEQANDQSYFPDISADGRYVAFQSRASNLTLPDTNNVHDIFVKDLHSGLVSRASITAAAVAPNNESYFPSISGDGRFVAFQSGASNLVPGDTNRQADIFLKDMQTGVLSRISTNESGGQADGTSNSVTLSEDGSLAAFVSRATNLVAGDTNRVADIFVKHLASGRVVLASSAEDGTPADATSEYGARHRPVFSADGRFVAFASTAGNLSDDDGPGWDIFVKDLNTGTVTLASIGDGDAQPSNGDSYQPSMTADGRHVAFMSTASNLVDGDLNGRADIFVKDLDTGQVELISDAWATDTGPGYSRFPAISDDGRFVMFSRVHLDFVDADVFLKDRLTGELILINTTTAGEASDRESKLPDLSARGGRIVFVSYSTDLVPGDTNARSDIFLTTLLSVLEGDDRGNALDGSFEDELIVGLGSADTLRGGPGDDALEGGDGNDRLYCDAGDDVAAGHSGDDIIYGAGGRDSVIGGPGRDLLHGGRQEDTLVGGDGNDTLNGFFDADTLIGGPGADLFAFKVAAHSPFGGGDLLVDFLSGIDRIELSDIGVDSFVGTDAFVAGDGVIEARFDAAAQQLQVDVNDDGSFGPGDLEVNGVAAVAAGDLVL